MAITDYGSNFIGNVIRIIDSRTILINVGKNRLKIGDTIQVYELGPEITDCDGTSLGNYEFIKDTLKVIEIHDNFSVCQKQDKTVSSGVSRISPLALSPLLSNTYTEYIPLNVCDEDIRSLEIQDPVIRIGNPVKLS